jgi:hypothetical protein
VETQQRREDEMNLYLSSLPLHVKISSSDVVETPILSHAFSLKETDE